VLTNQPYTTDAEPDEDSSIADLYRKLLVHFNEMPEEERLGFDPYHSTWKIGRNRIAELARRLELDPEAMIILYNQWLFDPARDTQFVLADLALGLVSCGVSEAAADRVLSMQEDIACLHGTRFGISTIEARLTSAKTLPGRRPDQDEMLLAGGDGPAGIDEDGSGASFEDMDPELGDDDDNADDDSDADE
jgi:hypothetical protein